MLRKKYYLHISYLFNEPTGIIYGDCFIDVVEINIVHLRHKIAEIAISYGQRPTVQPVIISMSELSKGLYKTLSKRIGE